MAQGLVALSHLDRRRLRAGLAAAVVLASLLDFLVLLKITIPFTPPNQLHAQGIDSFYGDTVGWPEIAREVRTMYAALPASARDSTVIISAYNGVPGALRVYGDPQQLPPVVSPQLTDWYWLPAHLGATTALMVDYQPRDVAWMCLSTRVVGHLTVPYHVVALEQGAPVIFCQLKAPISDLWGRLRNFS